MKRKVIISYKKNKVLNQARLTLDRELVSSIGVTDNKDNAISFVYKENEIKLRRINKTIIEKTILDKEQNLKEFTKNMSFSLNYTNKEKNYYTYNLSLFSPPFFKNNLFFKFFSLKFVQAKKHTYVILK